jgi:hypothetical protein
MGPRRHDDDRVRSHGSNIVSDFDKKKKKKHSKRHVHIASSRIRGHNNIKVILIVYEIISTISVHKY